MMKRRNSARRVTAAASLELIMTPASALSGSNESLGRCVLATAAAAPLMRTVQVVVRTLRACCDILVMITFVLIFVSVSFQRRFLYLTVLVKF